MFARPHKVFLNSHWIHGVGVHSGKPVQVRIVPGAHYNNGVKFVWRPSSNEKGICAFTRYDRVTSTQLQTVLTDPDTGLTVKTIEHLMAAIAVLGVANAQVTIFGEECELPILDGSAWPWIQALQPIIKPIVGMQQPMRTLKILRNVKVGNTADAWCELRPIQGEPRLEMCYVLNYTHPMIGKQMAWCEMRRSNHGITSELVKTLQSRTFGFEEQAVLLRLKGLALGAGLENTVVFNSEGVMNPEGQRHDLEPARHKLLDAIGDLSLARAFVVGAFYGYKSGHALNNQLLRAVFSDPSCYLITNH